MENTLPMNDVIKKILNKFERNELYKQLLTKIIEESISSNNYVSLIEKVAGFFELDLKNSQDFMRLLTSPNVIDEFHSEFPKEDLEFFKDLSIVYGDKVASIRTFFFSDNKTLLYESNIKVQKEKLELNIRRMDGERFYLELNLINSIIFMERISNSLCKLINKYGFPEIDEEEFQETLSKLKSNLQSLENKQPIGDTYDFDKD